MFKEKFDEFMCAALEQLMRALAALRELAWLNRRMTARGLVAALVFVGARFGRDVSAETQVGLASFLFIYLGLVGRDRPKQRS